MFIKSSTTYKKIINITYSNLNIYSKVNYMTAKQNKEKKNNNKNFTRRTVKRSYEKTNR